MTREEARKAAEVMLAYADGKEIEYKNGALKDWSITSVPTFNWGSNDYRIKPGSKYRPFKNAEECWQEMQKHQPFGWVRYKMKPIVIRSIASLYDTEIEPCDACTFSYKDALEIFAFADGTPFGIMEEA